MNLKSRKELVSRLYGVGTSRVKFDINELDDIKEGITKGDFRALKARGLIKILPSNGVSKVRHRKKLVQKRKGRRSGKGSFKGKAGARLSRKEKWILKVRSQREVLKKLKETGQISIQDFRKAYRHVKGNMYRSRRHLKTTLEEQGMIKKNGTTPKKKTTEN